MALSTPRPRRPKCETAFSLHTPSAVPCSRLKREMVLNALALALLNAPVFAPAPSTLRLPFVGPFVGPSVHPSFAPRSPPSSFSQVRALKRASSTSQNLDAQTVKRASNALPQHASNTPSSGPLNVFKRMPSTQSQWASNKPTSEPQTRLQRNVKDKLLFFLCCFLVSTILRDLISSSWDVARRSPLAPSPSNGHPQFCRKRALKRKLSTPSKSQTRHLRPLGCYHCVVALYCRA
jgi:hypothetical protein